MRRSLSMGGLGLACLALLASGCDNDSFAPPRRAKSSSTASGAGESKPTFLVMVVPGSPGHDVQEWGLRAQHESNDKRAIFRIMGPPPGKPDTEQPVVVRKAVADGASAVIVYPGEAPELARTLAEVEANGVPVVLLNKRIAAPEGARPFTVVEYGAFDVSAGQIVGATLEDLKKNHRPVDGTAIILADKVADPTSTRRVAALKSAAESAKFAKVVTIEFDGTNPDAAKAAAIEAVKSHPDVSIMLADDGEGFVGAAQVRSESKGKPVFFVGGFTNFAPSRVVSEPERESCYVDGRYVELGAQAVLTTLAKLRGEAVGEHAYLPLRFVRTEGAVSSESNPNSSVPELRPAVEAPAAPAKEAPSKQAEPKPQ